MKAVFASLAAMATAAVLFASTADAAYVSRYTGYGYNGVSHSRTVHNRYGNRTVRVIRGRSGQSCRVVNTSRRTAYGSVRSHRKVCN